MDLEENKIIDSNLSYSLRILAEKIGGVVERAVDLQEEILVLEDIASMLMGPPEAHDRPTPGKHPYLPADLFDLF